MKVHPPGYRVKLKGAGGANGNAGTAMGAPFLIAENILTERLYPHPSFSQIPDTLIILFLSATQFQYQQYFLFLGN